MTPEHAQARCGNATASDFSAILAPAKDGKDRKTRNAYLRRVVAEMLTGKPSETYRNSHMDRGQEQEPFARMAYEAQTGNFVEQVEFIKHPTLAAGCSPDGLIDPRGGAEIKSVIPTVQLDTILSGGYPLEHRAQIQGGMWIAERDWWDFVSFCPDMPTPALRLYIFRVQRDEPYIARLETEVASFVREAEQLRDRLLGRDTLADQLRASLEAA
jgi:hypothetical protein